MLPWRPGQILPQGSTIFGKEAPGEVGLPATVEGSLLERGVLDCSGQAARCPPSCSQGSEVGRECVCLPHTRTHPHPHPPQILPFTYTAISWSSGPHSTLLQSLPPWELRIWSPHSLLFSPFPTFRGWLYDTLGLLRFRELVIEPKIQVGTAWAWTVRWAWGQEGAAA